MSFSLEEYEFENEEIRNMVSSLTLNKSSYREQTDCIKDNKFN